MKYRSEICEVMHQDAIADFKVGAISEAEMREYDELCLASPKSERESATVYNEDAINLEHISHAAI
jgi:DNA-binding transcriptional regulator YiaG